MKLKNIRAEKNMSQSELSKLSGVSIRTIQAYEQEQISMNKASALNIYKIAKTLKCKYEDLLDIR